MDDASAPGLKSQTVSRMLSAVTNGHRSDADELFSIVYDELRAMAGSYFRGCDPSHTLQPTALVHEAYVKLLGSEDVPTRDREHFFALAARIMRQILVDHMRSKMRDKRGAGWSRISLDGAATPSADSEVDLLALEEALDRLASQSEQAARLVELRFFGGLTSEEAGNVIGISRATAARLWRFARAWLLAELQSEIG